MRSAGGKSISVSDFEALIQAGNFSAVGKVLRTMNMKRIPRAKLAEYARIANRAHQGNIAHRILLPVVRSDGKILVTPTDIEKLEYAEALRLMGVIPEAVRILNEIDFVNLPIVDLRMAFCLATQWRWGEAVPYLQRYLQNSDPKDYSHTIAMVNLAAAFLVEQRDEEALKLIEQLLVMTEKAGHNLLHGNCLELAARVYVRQRKFDRADQCLDEALRSFQDPQMKFSLYSRKWRAISRSLREGAVHEDLYNCRDLALQEKDWETQRDCDLYIGFLKKDESRLHHVYYGTPYASFRKRIVDLVGPSFDPPSTFVWDPLAAGNGRVGILDALEGKIEGTPDALETGHLMHRLLLLLCSDFYRPVSMGTAFSELFPDEQYSQQSSSNRVPQVVKRLREWLRNTGDLFRIHEEKGSYQLRAQAPAGIRVQREVPQLSSQQVTWKKVTSHLQNSSAFSRREVIQALNCSPASANRILRWAIEYGHAEALGAGPQRKYRIAA